MAHVILKAGAAAVVVALAALGAESPIVGPAHAQQQAAPAKPAPMKQELSRRTVQKVQAALNNKGFKLDLDGYLGDQTKAALKKYQQDNQLPATGEADAATMKKLGIS